MFPLRASLGTISATLKRWLLAAPAPCRCCKRVLELHLSEIFLYQTSLILCYIALLHSKKKKSALNGHLPEEIKKCNYRCLEVVFGGYILYYSNKKNKIYTLQTWEASHQDTYFKVKEMILDMEEKHLHHCISASKCLLTHPSCKT